MKPCRIDAPIVVQSSSIALGNALRHRACTGIERLASKYFGRLNAATIYFSREGKGYRCTVNVDMGPRRVITGEARGASCHGVLDSALRRAATRLRRLKRSLRDDKFPRFGGLPGLNPAPAPFRNAGVPRRGHRFATVPPDLRLALAGCDGLDAADWEFGLKCPSPQVEVSHCREQAWCAA